MVLLSVLGAIGIIYIMVVQMSADAMFTSKYYQKIYFKEKAYYISRSVYAGVQQLFYLDDADVDSFHDTWAMGIPPYEMEDEKVNVTVEIEDQERYINPNVLLSGANPKEENIELFRRLFRNLRIEPELVNALIDWIDADQIRRVPFGADGWDYTDIPSKGGPLDSIEEIKLIKGLNKHYQGTVVGNEKLAGLKDVLTVNSSGTINVNTAGPDVLMCLDDEMNEDLVAEIIRSRETEAIKKLDDLVDMAGMNYDLLYRIKKHAGVNSTTFKVTITVDSLDERDSAQLVVIFKRGSQAGEIIYWQAQ